MADTAPTWDLIKTYFTDNDVTCMCGQFNAQLDLHNCGQVLAYAPQIYPQVASGAMPQGGPPWSTEGVANFKAWMDSTPTCPDPSTQPTCPDV